MAVGDGGRAEKSPTKQIQRLSSLWPLTHAGTTSRGRAAKILPSHKSDSCTQCRSTRGSRCEIERWSPESGQPGLPNDAERSNELTPRRAACRGSEGFGERAA